MIRALSLLVACGTTDVVGLDPDVQDTFVDEWVQTDDEGMPFVEPLACLWLGSDGAVIIGDTDKSYDLSWHTVGPHTVMLTGYGRKLGTLDFDRLDSSQWFVTWDGSGYFGTVVARPGCDLFPQQEE